MRIPPLPDPSDGLVDWARHWLPQKRVCLLDTVVLDAAGKPDAWLYTSQSGEVCVKERASWERIGRRFSKFVQDEEAVTAFRQDGRRTTLSQSQWQRIVQDGVARKRLLRGLVGFQARLPTGEEMRCCVKGGEIVSPEDYSDQLRQATLALEQENVEAVFAIDKDDQPWLVDAHRTSVHDRPLLPALLTTSPTPLPSLPATTATRPSPWQKNKMQKQKRGERKRISHLDQCANGDSALDHSTSFTIDDAPEEEEDGEEANHENRLKAALLQAAAAEEEASTRAREANDARREQCADREKYEKALVEKTQEVERAKLEVDAIRARSAASGQSASSLQRSTSATVAGLLDQLEERGRALDEAKSAWAQERRELEADAAKQAHAAAVEAEARHDELRACVQEEQDRVALLESELESSKAKLIVATSQNSDLETRLEATTKEMREKDEAYRTATQSVRAAASLERNIPARDASSVEENKMNMGQSAVEARQRQLQNKVVFLKSSLEMEMEARQEIEKQLAESLDQLKTERAENDRRLAEASQLRETSLKMAEERAAAALEEAQSRAAHLENKLTQAQAAYTDALHDAGVARRREDAAKADAQREKAAREAAERAAELDRESLIAARNAKNGETAAEAENRVESSDHTTGLSRRLENENQYLKAQLTSEAMCKGELEAALVKATEQVEAAQRQGELAASKALESARVLAERAEKLERDLRSVASEKKAAENGLNKQLETLKAAYVKTRDGLRVEQAEHARTRMARGELISTMSQMRAERERAEQALKDVRERASKDLKAARRAFDDAEATAAETNRSTRDELTVALGKNDQLRNTNFRLECEVRDGEVMTTRVGQVGAVLGLTSRRSPWNRPRAFSAWKQATLRDRMVEEHRMALLEAKNEARALLDRETADASQRMATAHNDDLSAALAAKHAALSIDHERKLLEQEHAFGDRLASMVAATATHAVVESTVHKATLLQLDEARIRRSRLESRIEALTQDVFDREQQLAEKDKGERRRRAMRAAMAADRLAARAAVVADNSKRVRDNISTLRDEEPEQEAVSDGEPFVQDARLASRSAMATVFNADCSVAGEEVDSVIDAIDAAEASVAACSAWVVKSEKESTCDKLGRVARALLEEMRRVGAEEKKALQLSIEKESQLVSEGHEALLSERAAKVASNCAGLALREEVERTRRELDDANDALEKLSAATAQFAESEASRFEAAVVAANALQVEAERHGRVRASWDASLAASAASSALAAEAVDAERERWRQSLRDAETRSDERQAAAWRSGMEERDRVAKREASELRTAAERAVAEVKASASASLEAVRVDTKKAVDRAAQRAVEHETLAVKTAVDRTRAQWRAVHKDSVAACLAAGAASKQLAVEKVRAAENAMRQNQKAQHDRMRAASRRECDQLRCKVADVEDRLASETRRLEAQRAETFAAIERAETRTRKEYETKAKSVALLRDAEEAGRVASAAYAVNVVFETAMEAASVREHESVEAVAADADRHIEAILCDFEGRLDASNAAETALHAICNEKEAQIGCIEEQLVSCRAERISERRVSSFEKMKLAASAMRILTRERRSFDSKSLAHQAALEKLEVASEAASRDAQSERKVLETKIEQAEAMRSKIHEVLVNHERATLIAHKKRSAQLDGELKKILERRDEIEAKRDELMDGVEEMQEAVRELEDSMREHNKTSSISREGRVNLAHAKKKKRMDDEHDAILSDLERQRVELSDFDQTIQRLNEEREAKEDEIKDLERQLVELLVDQQKRLLAVLSAAET